MSGTTSKAMNLPPRREGPHAWLWRLLYREAELLVSRSSAAGDPDEAAEWLWRGVASGWVWIRRDRSGISWAEPDPWLRELVAAEAERHRALGDSRTPNGSGSDDEAAIGPPAAGPTGPAASRPTQERIAVIAGHIWRYLASGWARVSDHEDTILFWHPTIRRFVPFTADLEADYRRLFKSLRNLGTQVERRLSGGQPYTGRQASRALPEARAAYTGGAARRHAAARVASVDDTRGEPDGPATG